MERNPNISERLLQFIEHIGMGLGSFAYNCDISQTNVLSGKLTNRAIDKILSVYPELNPQWLKYGEGEMLGLAIEEHGVSVITTRQPKNKRELNKQRKRIVTPDNASKNKQTVHVKQRKHGSKKSRPYRNRLEVFRTFLGLSSSEFAKTIGVSESRVSKIDEDPLALLPIIYQKYPTLNSLWLEDGIGEMLLEKKEVCKIKAKKQRTEEWRREAQGYNWALGKVMEGVPRKEIIQEFNLRHEQDPSNYSTRTGKPLSDAILCTWIQNSGITPPVVERPHPYKKNIYSGEKDICILPPTTTKDNLASIVVHKNADLSQCEPMISCANSQLQIDTDNSDAGKGNDVSSSKYKLTAQHGKYCPKSTLSICGVLIGFFLVVGVIYLFGIPELFILIAAINLIFTFIIMFN